MKKWIDGIEVSGHSKDLRGKQYGRLRVISLVGRCPKRASLLWECRCECGNKISIASTYLVRGSTKSCGCYKEEVLKQNSSNFADKMHTHGWSGTKEHKTWKSIKERCLNKNNSRFETYSDLGISESFASDFMAFLEDIGPIPADIVGRVSVDRIDNTKGYVEGNVRWSDDNLQARNKRKSGSNTSGVTGVCKQGGKGAHGSWVAFCRENGSVKTKSFSINKYGDELAFFAACEMRELMIERLNMQGAGYTENHGK